MPPEPPSDSTDNCLPCNGETIIALSSDDSDDEESDHVYTLLGQQELADGSDSSDDDEDDDNVEEMPVPDLDNTAASSGDDQPGTLPAAPRPGGSEELALVWNSCAPSVSLPLNAEKAAQIQAAMANFTLPPSAVPAWAANIPEEQWKQGLLERLQRGNLNVLKSSDDCSNNN